MLEATAINIAIGLLALAMTVMMQLLTDDVLVRGDVQLLTTVAIAVIAMNLFRSAIAFVQSILIGQFGERLQLGLILDYGYKLLRLPMAYFDAHRSQAIGEQFPALTRAGASAQAEVRLHQRNYQEKQVSTVSEVQEAEAAVNLAREELARYQELPGTGAIPQLQVKEKEAALVNDLKARWRFGTRSG